MTKIGNKNFIRMSQLPPGLQEIITSQIRAGVDGVQLWKTGKRGEPFTVDTIADTTSTNNARTIFRTYESMVGDPPVDIEYDDISEAFSVVVLKVIPSGPGIVPILAAVGGLVTVSRALVRANWTLLPVKK